MDTEVFCKITNAHTDAVKAQRRRSAVTKTINRRRKMRAVGYALVILLQGIAVFAFGFILLYLLAMMRLVLK